MNTQNQLTETQKKALEVVKKLSEENKIDLNEAIQLIMAIYETQKEFVYVPYQSPYVEPYTIPWTNIPGTTSPISVPWWESNKIMCDANTSSTQGDMIPDLFAYSINDSDILKDWTI